MRRTLLLTTVLVTFLLGVTGCGNTRRVALRAVTQPERGAAAAVERWLVDQSTTLDAPRTAADRADINSWHAWEHGLPRTSLAADATPAAADGVVHATLTVSMAVAIGGPKTFHIPVTVHTRREGSAWFVSDVTSSRSQGLRTLETPTLVVSGNAAVLADADHASAARTIASEASQDMAYLDRDYRILHGPTHVFIFVSDSDAQTGQVFGTRVDPTGETAGFTFVSGNVDLIASAFFAESPDLQAGVVRHELTHVVTGSLQPYASTLLLEGLATYQQAPQFGGPQGIPMINLTGAQAEFDDRTFRFADLLDSHAQRFGTASQTRIDADYELAYAVIATIEDRYGHAKLEQALLRVKDGSSPSAAIDAETGLTTAEFAASVRAYIAEAIAHQRHEAGLD